MRKLLQPRMKHFMLRNVDFLEKQNKLLNFVIQMCLY